MIFLVGILSFAGGMASGAYVMYRIIALGLAEKMVKNPNLSHDLKKYFYFKKE